MKQLTINGNRILLVEVPEGTEQVEIHYTGEALICLGLYDSFSSLPPGSWQLLFADPLKPTEEEAAGVMDCEPGIDSWNFFVTSHGFTPGRVVGMIDRKK